MGTEEIEKLKEILSQIDVTDENKDLVKELNKELKKENYERVLFLIGKLRSGDYSLDEEEKEDISDNKKENTSDKSDEVEEKEDDEEDESNEIQTSDSEEEAIYPNELVNYKLEEDYIGLLLENPQSISMYYFVHDDCFFQSKKLLNIYKSVLFTEGEAYAPQVAKDMFDFATASEESYNLKYQLKEKVRYKKYDFEKIYMELRKLFILRKYYLLAPLKTTKDKIIDIKNYALYDNMSAEDVASAVEQILATEKFKRGVLTDNMTDFLITGDNNLTNGLELPFRVLSRVFKGIRKGETMAYAMPSNSGKSRLAIYMAAYIALVHKQKVLIISNEMSEDKMKLCLLTTIINTPYIQKLHGQKIQKSEGELLDFKFRPDDPKKVKVDEDGFIVKEEKETQRDFAKRISKISTEFNTIIKITEWLKKEIENKIYFINITDHTNDELKKVITNYYYKEKIEYMFYDTFKADIANIGNGEEVKKTATILSNLAQTFEIFICSSMQLSESSTLPINLSVNDLAISRTVKEVLDTFCLFKQISKETYDMYEYAYEEVDSKFMDLVKDKDPDERYYACVIDKNRAGAKPKLLFKLNLAYNRWEEKGYLFLKQNNDK